MPGVSRGGVANSPSVPGRPSSGCRNETWWTMPQRQPVGSAPKRASRSASASAAAVSATAGQLGARAEPAGRLALGEQAQRQPGAGPERAQEGARVLREAGGDDLAVPALEERLEDGGADAVRAHAGDPSRPAGRGAGRRPCRSAQQRRQARQHLGGAQVGGIGVHRPHVVRREGLAVVQDLAQPHGAVAGRPPAVERHGLLRDVDRAVVGRADPAARRDLRSWADRRTGW